MNISVSPSFTYGETISFNYTFTSSEDTTITYLPYISCPHAPMPFLVDYNVSLKANESYNSKYTLYEVTDLLEPQKCVAYIEITSPFFQHAEKNISINTKPSFGFHFSICEDNSCKNKAKVLLLGKIYLDYDSEIPDPLVDAEVEFPDGKVQTVQLPDAINADQIGTYTLTATVSSPGHKTMNKSTQFAIIEKEAEIPFVGKCNADNICNSEGEAGSGENYQNCPQDCPSGSLDNYCDGLSDNRCDPDCKPDGDPDCIAKPHSTYNVLPAIVLLMLILGVLVVVLQLKKKAKLSHNPRKKR